MMLLRPLALLSVVVGLSISAAAADPGKSAPLPCKITADAFAKIRIGMSEREAFRLLECDGILTSGEGGVAANYAFDEVNGGQAIMLVIQGRVKNCLLISNAILKIIECN